MPKRRTQQDRSPAISSYDGFLRIVASKIAVPPFEDVCDVLIKGLSESISDSVRLAVDEEHRAQLEMLLKEHRKICEKLDSICDKIINACKTTQEDHKRLINDFSVRMQEAFVECFKECVSNSVVREVSENINKSVSKSVKFAIGESITESVRVVVREELSLQAEKEMSKKEVENV